MSHLLEGDHLVNSDVTLNKFYWRVERKCFCKAETETDPQDAQGSQYNIFPPLVPGRTDIKPPLFYDIVLADCTFPLSRVHGRPSRCYGPPDNTFWVATHTGIIRKEVELAVT
jgi:hypothetical protein